jgi:hypothetical protein
MFNSRPMSAEDLRNEKRGPDPGTLLYLLISGHVATIIPFTRRHFGIHVFNRSGPIGLVILLLYAGATGEWAMWPYFWTWIAVMAIQNFRSNRQYRKGNVCHSRYDGWPALAMRLPFVRKESTAKESVEPLMCAVVGIAIGQFSQFLGLYIALGCFSIVLKGLFESAALKAQVRALRDAQIEQQQIVDAFHRRTTDW